MDLVIHCFDCNTTYKVDISNTSVDGPLIKTTCIACGKTVERNLSKFLSLQVEFLFKTTFEKLGYMFNFVELLEEKVNLREGGRFDG